MNGRGVGSKVGSGRDLGSQLADLLTLRAQGLLSQREYDEKLAEFESSMPRPAHLAEQDLPGGGLRFVLRDARSGRLLKKFDFHRGHEAAG